MSKLGLALIGGSAALNELERLEDRDTARQRAQKRFEWESQRAESDRQRAQKRFDWESQRAESDLSLLPYKTEADRSRYQLLGKQNNAALGLVDLQAENAKKKMQQDGISLDAAQTRMPDELAALANKAAVAKTLSEFDVENLPRAIAEKKLQGALSDADVYTASISKLADLIATKDKNAVIRFMNGMNDAGVFGKKHAPVSDVTIKQDPTTKENVFVATDAAGLPVLQMSASQMMRIRDSVGKIEYKTVNAGDSLVALKGGQATTIYTAPESARSAAAKQGPLERDVNYLVTHHGMTKDQALAHLNSAKTVSRDQFIIKGLQDIIAMNRQPTREEIAALGALYDSARQATSASQSASQNAQEPASNYLDIDNLDLDPQIKSQFKSLLDLH